MKDNFGDEIKVYTVAGRSNVYLDSHIDDRIGEFILTPAKARKLARKLKAAADELDPPVKVADDAPDVDPDEPAPAGGCCGGVCGEPESDDITLTLTREQARHLAALIGKTTHSTFDSAYRYLCANGAGNYNDLGVFVANEDVFSITVRTK